MSLKLFGGLRTDRQRALHTLQRQHDRAEARKNDKIEDYEHLISAEDMKKAREPDEWIVKRVKWVHFDELVARYRVNVKFQHKRGYHSMPFEDVCRMDHGYHDYVIDVARKDTVKHGDVLEEMESWKVLFPLVSCCFFLCTPSPPPLFYATTCCTLLACALAGLSRESYR